MAESGSLIADSLSDQEIQRQGGFALPHGSAKSGKMVNLHGKTRNWGVFWEAGQGLRLGGLLRKLSLSTNLVPPSRRSARMTDPYAELGLPADADDDAIRRRYLELVKQFSPERHPEKFAAIRRAYESLRDLETRLKYRLFEAGKDESIDAILEDLACRTNRRRLSLQALLSAVQKP
jgi:DnaJ domain